MDFALFHSRFPELAEAETRTITVFRHDQLPPDEYALLESYCERPDCDCRRVMLLVVAQSKQRLLAVISFGWEEAPFYRRWLGYDDPEMVAELQGPALNRMSEQSPLAPALLELVAETVLTDEAYITRLQRHYQLFKEDLKKGGEQGKKPPRRRGGY